MESYGLKFGGRLWAEVAWKAMGLSWEEGYGAEVAWKAMGLSWEEGYVLMLRERELLLLYICFIVRNDFKARKYILFLLWQDQARQVYCYESRHLPGYPMIAALLRTAIKRNALYA